MGQYTHKPPQQSKWKPGDEPTTYRQGLQSDGYGGVLTISSISSTSSTNLAPSLEKWTKCFNCLTPLMIEPQWSFALTATTANAIVFNHYANSHVCEKDWRFGMVMAPSPICWSEHVNKMKGLGWDLCLPLDAEEAVRLAVCESLSSSIVYFQVPSLQGNFVGSMA